MSDTTPTLDLLGAVKRQWWIVALAAAVALAVGAGAAMSAKPEYTATATVRVDAPAISRTYGAPTPDDMVRASTTDLRSQIANAGEFSAEQMAAVRFSTIGAPQSRVLIVATSPDKATAEKLAKVSALEAVKYAQASTANEIQRQSRQAEVAEKALSVLPPGTSVVDRWTLESALIDAQGLLKSVKNIYSFDEKVVVAVKAKTAGIRSTLAAALLLGVFVGVLIGGVREYLYRRKLDADAAA